MSESPEFTVYEAPAHQPKRRDLNRGYRNRNHNFSGVPPKSTTSPSAKSLERLQASGEVLNAMRATITPTIAKKVVGKRVITNNASKITRYFEESDDETTGKNVPLFYVSIEVQAGLYFP